jgi:predicted amidohydrolase YtcJ
VKGAEGMLHQNALQAARIHELEEQLAVVTRRKARKRKRLQHRGTLEYGEAADQVAASTALVANLSKKTRSSSAPERAPSTRRRCGTCGETGHNARTC